MSLISKIIRSSFSTFNNDKLILKELQSLVEELKSTNSGNAKVEILKKKPELRSILTSIYSPGVRFHITSEALSTKNTTKNNCVHPSIEDTLKTLSNRKVTGNAAVSLVKELIAAHPEYEELIKNMIDKNLKVRIGFGLIKKSFEIDEIESNICCTLGFSVEKHLDYLKKSLNEGQEWFVSRKYDGIRAILVYDHKQKYDKVRLLSRQMKPIKGLNPEVLSSILRDLGGIEESFVLDGELVSMNDGKEDFSQTISTVKSMDPKPIGGLQYKVFDEIIEELTFSQRQEKLMRRFSEHFKVVNLVSQTVLRSSENVDYERIIKQAQELGYEGFIIRRDCKLKNGRSRDLLKIKPFQDAEFKVVDHEIGTMRVFDDAGTEQSEQVLLSLSVDFNGSKVSVGSGFSIAERREFAKDPQKILNKIVTVRYQSECKAAGRSGNSLRFPVFKTLHGDKRSE